jgi:hypothetical protein
MKLTALTEMKHVAGYRKGCLCRYRYEFPLVRQAKVSRVPVMGCPVHEAKTLVIDDPENGGSEAGAYQAAGYAVDAVLATPPAKSPFVHGRLGEAEPGQLFQIVCDGPNDITLTGQGIALRMDRATLTALWRASADGLNHLNERGR